MASSEHDNPRYDKQQPHISPLDSGGEQVEWRCRQFEIEVCFDGEGNCNGVYVKDLVTGYELEWDDVEGRT